MNEISVDNGRTDPMPFQNAPGLPPDSPFINLNAIVLSIEWEITDDIMAKLMSEIHALKEKLKKSKGLYSFLHLHGTIGKYIMEKRGAAHPDSIKLLHSVHNGLVAVVSTPDWPVTKKNAILAAEIRKYNRLRERILETKMAELGITASTKTRTQEKNTPGTTAKADLPEALSLAIEEIKAYIKDEFAALKDDLKPLTKG